jgi:hypothetical protein
MVEDSTDQAQSKRITQMKYGGPSWLIWIPFVLLPVLYVLSVGPVTRCFWYINGGAPPPLQNFYAPLGVLADHVPPFRTFLDWYIDTFWVPQPTLAPPAPQKSPSPN